MVFKEVHHQTAGNNPYQQLHYKYLVNLKSREERCIRNPCGRHPKLRIMARPRIFIPMETRDAWPETVQQFAHKTQSLLPPHH